MQASGMKNCMGIIDKQKHVSRQVRLYTHAIDNRNVSVYQFIMQVESCALDHYSVKHVMYIGIPTYSSIVRQFHLTKQPLEHRSSAGDESGCPDMEHVRSPAWLERGVASQ